jgi:NADH:ubiquinone oxidoreductase subunit F (NADH-binding)
MLDGTIHGKLDNGALRDLIAGVRAADRAASSAEPAGPEAGPASEASLLRPALPGEVRVALRNAGLVPPLDLEAWMEAGGYASLRGALGREPEAVVAELEAAGLRGRGGAGFPTGVKERSAGSACRDDCLRYVVCNADEGEPGTFKDRVIMEEEPHLLIEGIVISAYAIGARRGFIYVRGEYGMAIDRLGAAIAAARGRGLLGERILGSDFSFDLELRRGQGSYLCGEELTLIESLEGRRGYPRIKPPFPAESGFQGAPTLVNNVETLAFVPWIVERGAEAFRALGTAGSPGSKVFCLSGDVERPGVYEYGLGLRLRDLIEGAGGGLRGGGGEATAVLLGGAAGTFVPPGLFDLALDYDGLKAQGLTLGSGAVIVLGPGRRLAPTLRAVMEFFTHECCGKCVPCRIGTARLARSAAALEGAPAPARFALLEAMVAEAEAMAKTSLCPLGQSPILPLRSALRLRDAL